MSVVLLGDSVIGLCLGIFGSLRVFRNPLIRDSRGFTLLHPRVGKRVLLTVWKALPSRLNQYTLKWVLLVNEGKV